MWIFVKRDKVAVSWWENLQHGVCEVAGSGKKEREAEKREKQG